VVAIALAGLGVAGLLAGWVERRGIGNRAMQEVAQAIREGADAFLGRQYRTILLLTAGLGIVILAVYGLGQRNWTYAWHTSLAFVLGALCSAAAGYIGMKVSIRANLRTAAATLDGVSKGFLIAVRGGAVSGLSVVALSLLGVGILFYAFGGLENPKEIPFLIVGYGFGASFVALFAQLGGGIYTKAADVGADLVGKVEAGIPEDDARNPAVVADLVGDNVGDCAGRGADLFESTAAENIGAMILGVGLFPVFGIWGVLFPLVVRAGGLIASIIAIVTVRMKETEDPMRAINRGFLTTFILSLIVFWITTHFMLQGNWWLFAAGATGLVTSLLFLYATQYYTESRYRPVQAIAEASKTGPATNIIAGLAVALECTAIPVVIVAAALWLSYYFGVRAVAGDAGVSSLAGGLFGTAVATMGMLAPCAYILALDTFGPITDNAGGILELSKSGEHARERTDRLDAVGNTTKALTKGYAIGSAALAAFLLFSAYMDEVTKIFHEKGWTDRQFHSVDISKMEVFVGGLMGAMLVFLFSALAIRAVGRAAGAIILEVRRQFKEKPGILQGTDKPDYGRCVDIVTARALREMVPPGLLVVVAPLAVGLIFKRTGLGAEAVAALLMVGTIAGILLATMMNNGGGAWDNAKKFIEGGALGGRGSEAHKAAVVGDTVGDPLKDTAGPSIHVLIKLLSTLTLVFAPLFI
jgi:K(+)-stimulated pyrophosphate-energized sodium pump